MKKLILVLGIVAILLLMAYWLMSLTKQSVTKAPTEPVLVEREDVSPLEGKQQEQTTSDLNVNPQFAETPPEDKLSLRRWAPPVIRDAFLEKGNNVILSKHPYAADANFRGVYFHLGHKDKPASCGEVQFIGHDGSTIGDFERFVYSGRASAYVESELPDSFEVIWQKICVDTLGSNKNNTN